MQQKQILKVFRVCLYVDTSSITLKTNLESLNTEVDKLDIDK